MDTDGGRHSGLVEQGGTAAWGPAGRRRAGPRADERTIMAQRGSDEIRTKAIADLARGYKPRTVAKRHDVHVSTVYYWRNQTQKARRRPGAAVSDARLLRGTSPFH